MSARGPAPPPRVYRTAALPVEVFAVVEFHRKVFLFM